MLLKHLDIPYAFLMANDSRVKWHNVERRPPNGERYPGHVATGRLRRGDYSHSVLTGRSTTR